ncbi:MAG: tRNA lysidine(34) synthetase TilS [Rickettsiales bacterium]|jgi:tRNA(Ile)-lysidine synthase|nr:tRNA lysidine(34) synthetase TilS [Rickettsiales bacterium]
MQELFNKKMDRLCPGAPKIAAAVSGGADSTCLAIMLNEWARARGAEAAAITVDHGLRPESAREALWVRGQMEKIKMRHFILSHDGPKPHRNIEAAAREYRYRMLAQWCGERGFPFLAAAHNADEQAETFLMNIARGSGVYGLAAMPPKSRLGDICLVRPMLDFAKADIIGFLGSRGQEWVEDPMNKDARFFRARVRDAMRGLEIPHTRVALCIENMARARDAIEHYTREFLGEPISIPRLRSVPLEIAFRALGGMLGARYAPRLKSIIGLYEKIVSPGFKRATLGGFVISAGKDGVLAFTREGKRI